MSEENCFEDELSKRLRAITPEGIDQARDRAKIAARLRLGVNEADKSTFAPAQPRVRPRRGLIGHLFSLRASSLAGAAMLAIVLLCTLTSPGQAVAEWVGQRFGIGEPGGEPTLGSLREFADEGNAGPKYDYIVLAAGDHEIGGRFEIVTSDRLIDGNRCFGLDTLGGGAKGYKGGGISGGACTPLARSHGMVLEFLGSQLGLGRDMPLGAGIQSIGGRVSADVAEVEVTLNGRPLEDELIEPEPEILSRAGIEHPFKFFISFTDDFLSGGVAVARGFDAEGNQLVERRHRLVNHVEMHRAVCDSARERLRRRFDRGQERFAEMECELADALEATTAGSRP